MPPFSATTVPSGEFQFILGTQQPLLVLEGDEMDQEVKVGDLVDSTVLIP